jgi:lipoate-protein ligase B
LSNSTEPAIEIHRHSSNDPWTYEALDRRQREIARRVSEGGPGALILSEVSPVITVGRRTPENDLLLDDSTLKKAGIERVTTDRGGLATYHGPGQWVLFPVDRLDRLTGDSRGVRRAVDVLLQIALDVATQFGVKAEIRQEAELGVWSPRGKIAAVGIHIEGRILLHGMSLNVFRTPQSFVGLRPCGLEPAVDFLSQNPDPAAFGRVKDALIESALTRLWS